MMTLEELQEFSKKVSEKNGDEQEVELTPEEREKNWQKLLKEASKAKEESEKISHQQEVGFYQSLQHLRHSNSPPK